MAEKIAAFDFNETITDMMPIESAMQEIGLHMGTMNLWFALTIRNGLAFAAADDFRPFTEVAADTLRQVMIEFDLEPDSEAIKKVMGQFPRLKAHPDVEPSLQLLRDAGVKPVILTIGAPKTTETILENNGLKKYFDDFFYAEQVRRWKPHAALYQHAASELGAGLEQLCLFTVHAWDSMGAQKVGCKVAWASRLEKEFDPLMGTPDFSGDSLVDVARQYIEAPVGALA